MLDDDDGSVRTYSAEAHNRPPTHHHENATLSGVLNRVTELFASEADEFRLLVEVAGRSLVTFWASADSMFVSTWVANDPETARRRCEFSERCVIRLRRIAVETLKAPADSMHYVLHLPRLEQLRILEITEELFQSVHQRASGLSMHW